MTVPKGLLLFFIAKRNFSKICVVSQAIVSLPLEGKVSAKRSDEVSSNFSRLLLSKKMNINIFTYIRKILINFFVGIPENLYTSFIQIIIT